MTWVKFLFSSLANTNKPCVVVLIFNLSYSSSITISLSFFQIKRFKGNYTFIFFCIVLNYASMFCLVLSRPVSSCLVFIRLVFIRLVSICLVCCFPPPLFSSTSFPSLLAHTLKPCTHTLQPLPPLVYSVCLLCVSCVFCVVKSAFFSLRGFFALHESK